MTNYTADYGDGEHPSDFGTRFRFTFIMAGRAAQRLADANGAPVGIWERGGIYAISEDPPETICPDPAEDGWKLGAIVDPQDVD